jgi:hypothetical protein
MPTIKLDTDRSLRFTFKAFLALEETCKINVYTLDLRTLSPGQVRDLVWASQLNTNKPLSREQVAKYLPPVTEDLSKVIEAVVEALAASYGAGDTDEAPGA